MRILFSEFAVKQVVSPPLERWGGEVRYICIYSEDKMQVLFPKIGKTKGQRVGKKEINGVFSLFYLEYAKLNVASLEYIAKMHRSMHCCFFKKNMYMAAHLSDNSGCFH